MAAVTAGCGQKGDLYLPEEKYAALNPVKQPG